MCSMPRNMTARWMVVLAWIVATSHMCTAESRSKRFLLFPRSAPTRMQLITGIGLPVDLDLESLTVGYVFKAEYFLPWNVSSFYNFLEAPFKPYPIRVEGRSQRDVDSQRATNESNVERYSVEAKLVEEDEVPANAHSEHDEEPQSSHWYDTPDADSDDDDQYSLEDIKVQSPQDLSHSRFTLYKAIEKLAETSGVPGRPCLLRSICETAEAPFSYSNGILGELAHLIMTPSSTVDELSEHSDNEYLKAEELGTSGAPCEMIFHECPSSLLSRFSGIYETLNMYG